MSDRPVLFVDLKQSRRRWPLGRPQRWTWRALNANNSRVLARSSESYTNRQDCLDAIVQVFSGETICYLREAERGNKVLRLIDPPAA